MRLSWNEVRARAAVFAEDWKDAAYEKGETQSFYNEFFQVFGKRRREVARYEQHVAKFDDRSGFIDLFWPGVLLVEQKSAGRDLRKAYEQAGQYFDALPERERPRFILVSDFQTFELHDLDEREVVAFPLADLPAHVESFGFILGVQRRTFRDQDPANIEAAELVGRLHDALADAGHGGHDLERFLVRMVFCMFADDTGVFEPRDIFLDFIETRTGEDGADLGPWLAQLFEVLDTPEDGRAATLDEDLARFPYVNGDLFEGHLRTFSFDTAMRGALLDACRFDWSNISPAIFGALFQSVMDPTERRAKGAHYTTEKNILKVIEPLFMDDLRAEFERVRKRRGRGRGRLAALRQFQAKLGGLTFFDPACGCGNFLIIAYRELRMLEIEVIRDIRDATAATDQAVLDAAWQSVVDVDQFYGIELGEFPARIAETALWMMDHIMNNRLSLEFGQTFVRIPLEKSPHIVHGDALETDWSGLLPSDDCSFVLGNPPFVGAKYQTAEQRAQVRGIAALGKSGGTLDYVAAWFIKAGEHLKGSRARIGFVATNSITQGEQVAQLWPVLFGRCKLEIAFAHRTFAWGSDARGKAHVHVVILGLDRRKAARAEKRLFSYPDINGDPEESDHAALSPYLFDAGGLSDPHLVVQEESAPINGMNRLVIGSKPIDGGNYIFDAAERAEFLETEPDAAPLLHPFIGAREYLQGGERWILALHDAPPEVLARLSRVRERVAAVRAYREDSKSAPTRKLAETPTLYHVNVIPTAPFLVVPKVSSERREYVPTGWLEPPTVPSDLVFVLQSASLADFALLTSAMHMAWLRHIGGRLKSDYRYSIGLGVCRIWHTVSDKIRARSGECREFTMSDPFKPVDRDTPYLLPPSLQDWLPQEHLARFVVEIVDRLDLSELERAYGGRGKTPYHPAVMVALLFYGYATGVFSSRKLELATYDSVAFRYITADTHPDHDTIAHFRKRFLEPLRGLFVQILVIAQAMGVLKIGTVSLDGTKVKANASKHKAMSWGYANRLEAQLREEVKTLLEQAARADTEASPGLDIPEELERREARLAAIERAKAEIERRALKRYEAEQAEYEEKLKRRRDTEKATGKKARGREPKAPEPGPRAKDQVNFTDEESRIMPSSEGFVQGYNAQAAVDIDSHVIVAEHVSDHTNDKQELAPALRCLDERQEVVGQPRALLADAGYFSDENVKRCEAEGIEPYIASGRERHHRPLADRLAPVPERPAQADGVAAMGHRMKTPEGRALYAKRKSTVETVFGVIKEVMGFRRFHLRGLEAVQGEWALVCMAWNLKRMHVAVA